MAFSCASDKFPGVQILTGHTAEAIDPERTAVSAVRSDGTRVEIGFDRVLIATGAHPVQPKITGLDLPGVFPFHTMEDSFAVREYSNQTSRTGRIAGTGYIGMEMADAFTHRGLGVTVASRTKSILPAVDREFGEESRQN